VCLPKTQRWQLAVRPPRAVSTTTAGSIGPLRSDPDTIDSQRHALLRVGFHHGLGLQKLADARRGCKVQAYTRVAKSFNPLQSETICHTNGSGLGKI